MYKVSTHLKENCRRSLLNKITSILYTDGHTDRDKDRQADSSLPRKHSFYIGIMKTKLCFLKEVYS